MSQSAKNVAVLGSTGSIGTSALEVIAASQGQLRALAMAACTSTELLLEQARKLHPRWVVVSDADASARQEWGGFSRETKLLAGPDALRSVVTGPEIDIVLTAIVGAAALESTWAALEAGKTIALANKETLVMAGPLVMQLATR